MATLFTRRLWKAVGLIPLMAAGLAQAADGEPSAFRFSGFGTVGLGVSNNSEWRYVNASQVYGFTKSVSGDVDSRLGLQGNWTLNPMFSATGQVFVRQNGQGNYEPSVEWAFVKAKLSPSLNIRVGRMGTPYFGVSDFRDVGYANIWIRPPIDVYAQVANRWHEGVDASYQFDLGGTNVTVQALTGRSVAKGPTFTSTLRPMLGLNLIAELENGLTLRLGTVQTRLTIDSSLLGPVVGFLKTNGFAAAADQLEVNRKHASFTGLGLAYDQNDWIVNSEYTLRRTDSLVADTTGWFVTLGHRFGSFAPYLTVSQTKVDSYNLGPFPAPIQPLFDGLFAGQNANQKTTALGVRWDAMRNVAVKAQWDSVKPQTHGWFNGNVAAPTPGQRIQVFSVAADFVF